MLGIVEVAVGGVTLAAAAWPYLGKMILLPFSRPVLASSAAALALTGAARVLLAGRRGATAVGGAVRAPWGFRLLGAAQIALVVAAGVLFRHAYATKGWGDVQVALMVLAPVTFYVLLAGLGAASGLLTPRPVLAGVTASEGRDRRVVVLHAVLLSLLVLAFAVAVGFAFLLIFLDALGTGIGGIH